MPPRNIRTTDIARSLGVHVNTVRKYEELGYLSAVPRGANGYRQYSALHMEQARLAHLALSWPYLGDKTLLVDLVHCVAGGDLGMAMELAYKYLAHVRVERTYAEAAVEFLERWATGHVIDAPRPHMHIQAAAQHLQVTVDMLRNWERNGLIVVPRDSSGYRVYGTAEFGRLRVIRTLIQSGYSLMSIMRMFQQFDAGQTHNLRASLDMAPDDEELRSVADRWLSSLHEIEARAQRVIQQIGRIISMVAASS